MFIETAVKNIALNRIMIDSNSESIQKMLNNVVMSYNNLPATSNEAQKKKAQHNKLRLENSIHSSISRAYDKDNPQITHFYNNSNHNGVPLWALFEIITLGDFANLLSHLTFDTRDHITSDLGIQAAAIDTNRELIYRYLYMLKDLRNAVAHNAVVFDTRFRTSDPSRAMTENLKNAFCLPYVNFKTIGDYLILICYYLELLKVSKTEIKSFIRDFEKNTNNYCRAVDSRVSRVVVHPDLTARLQMLKNSI